MSNKEKNLEEMSPLELLNRLESMIDDYMFMFDKYSKYLKEKGLEDDFRRFLEKENRHA
ncbi:MAG: hypothetical protein IKG62_04760 [Lachnospiraceae bacterium]|nr:hypothetical protein [Lachnospiraceae bacterium]